MKPLLVSAEDLRGIVDMESAIDAGTTLARSQVLRIASIQQAIQDEQADIYDPVQRGVSNSSRSGPSWSASRKVAQRPEQITFFKNTAGQGVADVALGALVLKTIQDNKRGMVLEI